MRTVAVFTSLKRTDSILPCVGDASLQKALKTLNLRNPSLRERSELARVQTLLLIRLGEP